MRSLKSNNNGSFVNLAYFVLTVIACGALYSLFFLEIGFPTFDSYIPASDGKTFIMMCLYAIPLFVIVIGVFSLLKSGLKRGEYR